MNAVSAPANEIKNQQITKSVKIKIKGVNQLLSNAGIGNNVKTETILIQPNAEYQFENQKNADLTISIIAGRMESENNEIWGADEMIYLRAGAAYRVKNRCANEPVIAVITRCDPSAIN